MKRKTTLSKVSGNKRSLIVGWIIVGIIAVIAIGGWLVKIVNRNQASSVVGAPVIVLPPLKAEQPYADFLNETYVRTWPGIDYPAVGIIQQGQQAQIVGRDSGATWWVILLPTDKVPAGMGWVSATDVQVNDAEDVQVMVSEGPPPAVSFPESTVASNDAYLTIGDSVYLRAGPGAEYPVYAILYKDMTLKIIGKSKDSNWWQIFMPPDFIGAENGWVYNQFIETFNTENVPIIEPPTQEQKLNPSPVMPDDPQITVIESVYVRDGPSNEYAAYGTLERGTKVKVAGISEDMLWWVVEMPAQYNGVQGWIEVVYCYAAKITNINAIPAPPLAK
jgi:uncharacterized protein YgiM (DUF1202 family)